MRQIVKYVKLLSVINQKAALIDEIFGVPRFKQQAGNYKPPGLYNRLGCSSFEVFVDLT